jgi:hypothetical protein
VHGRSLFQAQHRIEDGKIKVRRIKRRFLRVKR